MKTTGLFLTTAVALFMAGGISISHGQGLATRAYQMRMNGDPHGALAFLDSALTQHPDSASIWFEKGRCMDWIKTEGCEKFTHTWKYLAPRLRECRRCFSQAIRLDPGNARYHYWASEIAALRGMVGFYSPWKWPAVPFIMKHCVKEAETAVRLEHENPDYRYSMVSFARFGPLLGGNKKIARAHADTLDRLDPVYGTMALEELATKKHPYDAISRYHDLETKYPEHIKLLHRLAMHYTYSDTTHADTAISYYKRILDIDPANAAALNQLYRKLPKNRKHEAIPLIHNYLKEVEQNFNYYKAPAHRLLGQWYQQNGDPEKAKASFAEANRLNPNNNGTSNIDILPPG